MIHIMFVISTRFLVLFVSEDIEMIHVEIIVCVIGHSSVSLTDVRISFCVWTVG